MACNEHLRREGNSYPRTCADCGLGPCKNFVTPDRRHRDRMIDESQELNARIDKLSAFLWTDKFMDLDRKDRELLVEQHAYMKAYSAVLIERLGRP